MRNMSYLSNVASKMGGSCENAVLGLLYAWLALANGTSKRSLIMCDAAKIEERKIIVRDNMRVHHFVEGVCSYGNFWWLKV